MKFRISHHTRYDYEEGVFLEPQHLYYYPLPRNYLTLNEFSLTLNPASSGLAQRVDAENNLYHQCWFNEVIVLLEIDVEILIETEVVNPFNFLVEKEPKTEHTEALKVYQKPLVLREEIMKWLEEKEKVCGGEIITFLTFLTQEIHQKWDHEINYQSDLISPDECFNSANASCRDLSWMMIQMLRNKNIPARFVSGYAYNPDLSHGHELHAWVEAWVPGAGWIGLDPSAGALATEKYIPIATSYHPKNTLPVQGSFRGHAVSNLTTKVEIVAV